MICPIRVTSTFIVSVEQVGFDEKQDGNARFSAPTSGRAGHLGKSISFYDPARESDRRIAPDLALKLQEVGSRHADSHRIYFFCRLVKRYPTFFAISPKAVRASIAMVHMDETRM